MSQIFSNISYWKADKINKRKFVCPWNSKRSLILFDFAEMQIFNISKGLKPLLHQNTRKIYIRGNNKMKIGFEYKEYTCATCRPWGQILLYCIYRHSLTSKECIVFCWKKTIIFIESMRNGKCWHIHMKKTKHTSLHFSFKT